MSEPLGCIGLHARYVSGCPDCARIFDLCECGHPRDRHWMGLGQPGTCQCQIDKRHPGAGGDTLWPCPCKGFRPLAGSSSGEKEA